MLKNPSTSFPEIGSSPKLKYENRGHLRFFNVVTVVFTLCESCYACRECLGGKLAYRSLKKAFIYAKGLRDERS